MSDYRVRQRDIIPEHLLSELKVCIVGCGAIGSHTANSLARMGVSNFILIDPDTVSKENVSNQGFYPSDVNKDKVLVVEDDIKSINYHAHVEVFKDRLGLHHELIVPTCSILISAVDNMATRKQCLDLAMRTGIRYLIDPRMGAENIVMCTVDVSKYNLGMCDWYDNMLFSDNVAVDEPCTAKSTIYTALLISGLVTKAVKDIMLNADYTSFMSWNVGKNALLDYNNAGVV